MLHDEGEQLMLDVFLRGATPPAGFFVGLCAGTPVEASTLASLTGEPSGNGYARIALERSNVGWPTLASDAGDYKATAKEVTFLADTAAWPGVTHAFVGTSSDNTGKLVTSMALAALRTLQPTDSLKTTVAIKQQ